MSLLWKIIRMFGRGLLGLLIFLALSIAWTTALFFINPWSNIESGQWPAMHPIIVGNHESGQTRVLPYRRFEEEKKKLPALLPWPLIPSGSGQEGRANTAWQSVTDKTWQFEARWDDGDHILESRYRLEGERPVLVAIRGRDPGLGFIGVILASISLLIWKGAQWWRRRRQAMAKA